MNRVEIAMTVIGLVATFALPWPAEDGRAGDVVRTETVVVAPEACTRKQPVGDVPVAPSHVQAADHRSSKRG